MKQLVSTAMRRAMRETFDGRIPPSPGTPGEGRGGGVTVDFRGLSAPTLTLPRSTGGGNKSGPPKRARILTGGSGQLVLVALVMMLTVQSRARGGSFADPPPVAVADLKGVSVSEHLGNPVPLDLSFVDETGNPVQLRQYFTGHKPVVLQLGYYGCPMLCSLMSHGLVDAFKTAGLTPGADYEIVFISIDPAETPSLATRKKEAYTSEFGRDGAAGWHFLTGREEAIKTVAQAVGFNYQWVPSARQFAHPAVMTLCMPDGRISRYLYGVKFDPQTVRLSLVEASDGKIGNAVDQLFLTCFQYDGKQGRYAMAALTIMRAGGVLTMIIVGVVLVRMFRREARQRQREGVLAG